jgi:DNA-binding Lrp family transcriptional regulator
VTAIVLDNAIERPRREHRDRLKISDFSKVDKEIAHALLNSSGRITTMQLHMTTGLPVGTLAKRRKKLEEKYINVHYDLNLNVVGYVRMDLIVAAGGNGNIGVVAERLLDLPFVSSVSRIFGTSKHNLLVEVVTEAGDFARIANIIDMIRRIENIQEVQWFIDVEEMGKNGDAIMSIIDAQ